MNPKVLRQCADDIDEHSAAFDLTHYMEFDVRNIRRVLGEVGPRASVFHNCGTTACVAGFIAARHDPDGSVSDESIVDAAMNALGCFYEEAKWLFGSAHLTIWSQNGFSDLDSVIAADASRILRELARTIEQDDPWGPPNDDELPWDGDDDE
jgi:hypothetical protein